MRHLRHAILVAAMFNIVFSAVASQWVALLISVGVFIYLAPPHTPPDYPQPRISELESWERALRVEFYANDITAEEFEAEYWRYLLIHDQKREKLRRARHDYTDADGELQSAGCSCNDCTKVYG